VAEPEDLAVSPAVKIVRFRIRKPEDLPEIVCVRCVAPGMGAAK
jgi:hypothetical protein